MRQQLVDGFKIASDYTVVDKHVYVLSKDAEQRGLVHLVVTVSREAQALDIGADDDSDEQTQTQSGIGGSIDIAAHTVGKVALGRRQSTSK